MTNHAKPSLGKLVPGDEVLVIQPYSKNIFDRTGLNNPIRARVVSVARVWIKLESVETRKTTYGVLPESRWRMRLDTQNEGSSYGQNNQFVTPAQYDFEKVERGARVYLHEQGITIENRSTAWRGREVELAMLLQAHEAKRENSEVDPS